MFWGMLGIVVSVFCAIIPFLLTQQEKTLRYWQIEAESIFSNKIKEIKDLNISYKGNKLSDNVVILKTVIENNGNKDIDSTIIYEPMRIIFQEGIQLLDFELLESPSGVTLHAIDNGIECRWDLFKKKEFIVVKIVLKKNAEEPKNNDLLKKYINITYRMTNIGDIKKRSYKKSLSEKPSKDFLVYFLLAFWGTAVILVLLSRDSYQIRYKSSLLPNQTFSIKANNERTIILKGALQKRIVSIDDYNDAKLETEIVLIKERLNWGILILIFIAISMLFVPFVVSLYEYFIDKKIHSFFENNDYQ